MKKDIIGIIGLGYVGLPLALAISKKKFVVGFDKNFERIKELKKGKDRNNEFKKEIKNINKNIKLTSESNFLSKCNIFIVTVPTPVNIKNLPNLKYLSDACKIVGKYIKKDSIFILESTVYPGCLEDYCVPIIEKISKLKFNKDFYCGYSPERVNPGDKKHSIDKITKIISASNSKTLKKIKGLYGLVTKKLHVAKTIKIAESAKVIENIQRDINIALMNEISIILKNMYFKTKEVLEAASTKWNFLNFTPGLVGGHCIGVDPYYFTYKAEKFNYKPKIILAGRKINNHMATYVYQKIYLLKKKFFGKKKINILVLGLTFKENVSDIRNSQVIKIIKMMKDKDFKIYAFDPHISKNIDIKNKKVKIKKTLNIRGFFDAVFIATPHQKIINMGGKKIKSLCKKKSFIYDLKSSLEEKYIDESLN